MHDCNKPSFVADSHCSAQSIYCLKKWSIFNIIWLMRQLKRWRHDTQHNDIQTNDSQRNHTPHKRLISDIEHNDTQHKETLPLCWISLRWVSQFIYWYAVSLGWMSLCWVLLGWTSLCWVSLGWMALCWVPWHQKIAR
jgi:hypothetical protein